jgi:transmembrane sensor
MSEARNIPEAVHEEAAGWFMRLQGEGAAADDWAAFERWLAEDPGHARAYEQLERLWIELDDHAPALARALAPAEQPDRRPRIAPARGRTMTRRLWIATAGGAIAAGLAAAIVLQPPPGPGAWQDGATSYQAPAGQVRQISLADGTKVHLNAGSRIAVRMDRDARRVTMADAEAAFDVPRDPDRAFLIRVDDRVIRGGGAEFNLRHRQGRTVLTVRRGAVEVRPARSRAAKPVRVTVGHQFVHEQASGRWTVAEVDPDAAFGWTAASWSGDPEG